MIAVAQGVFLYPYTVLFSQQFTIYLNSSDFLNKKTVTRLLLPKFVLV